MHVASIQADASTWRGRPNIAHGHSLSGSWLRVKQSTKSVDAKIPSAEDWITARRSARELRTLPLLSKNPSQALNVPQNHLVEHDTPALTPLAEALP